MADNMKIGDLLVKHGKITETQKRDIIALQEKYKRQSIQNGGSRNATKKFGEIVVERGLISNGDLAKFISDEFNIPLYDKNTIDSSDFDINIAKKLKESTSREIKCIVLKKETNGKYDVLAVDPTDYGIKFKLKNVLNTDISNFKFSVISQDNFDSIFNKIYKYDISINLIEAEDRAYKKDDELINISHDNRLNSIMDTIIGTAIKERASDIHIEPVDNEIVVRYRIDGELAIINQRFPEVVGQRLITKFLMDSGCSIEKVMSPLDGRFEKQYAGQTYDFRTNFFPITKSDKETSTSIAIRILRRDALNADISEIGLSERTFKEFTKIVSEPSGLFLVVGPMGTGKTSTLYSTIKYLDPLKNKIITLEDPIEFSLPYVSQSQIDEAKGYGFEEGLRAILRADADKILVGEIRDGKVASLAFRGAEIGRLVLSTLHVNDCISTILRLIDLGVQPYFIAAFLCGVVSQRLLRRICPHCREQYIPKKSEVELVKRVLGEDISGLKLYKSKGCDKCGNTGYINRIAVFEVLNFKENIELRNAIHSDLNLQKLSEIAYKTGFKPMIVDAVEKVLKGYTTFDEVYRRLDANQIHYKI